jgi:hypothetical protein
MPDNRLRPRQILDFGLWILDLRGKSKIQNPKSKIALVALATTLAILLAQLPPRASSQAQFGDPAFRALWERTDGPVASRAAERGWVWGAVPGRTLAEPFTGLEGDSHTVQYFDKGRMEINDPGADRDDPFYVTNGLLAVELISGLQQNGLTTYQRRAPAAINLASDADDPSAPTYQSFNGVANVPNAPNERRKADATGTLVRTAIDRQGVTQPWPESHPDYGVRIARYEPATGHNIPDVFWEYLNSQTRIMQDGELVTGPLFYPWFSATGYPISEAYWSYVKVEGRYTDVLTQAYERRVLTFVPHFQVGFKVQMGNIGTHYYDWRYLNAGPPAPGPAPATPTAPALPPKPAINIVGIEYRKSVTDLNGDLAVLTNGGQTPVSFNGWFLDSPKWDHVDRYFFPANFTLAPGASVRVRSGPGLNTATDLYMFRTTVMWDGMAYDLAVLYDNNGREVTRYFPAAETGPPPTQQPAITATAAPPQGTAVRTATSIPGTPGARTATPTPTRGIPSPEATEATAIPTATKERTTPTATTTPRP